MKEPIPWHEALCAEFCSYFETPECEHCGDEKGGSMDNNRLKIEYKLAGGVLDAALEEDLREVLERHGWKRWAEGFDLTENVRDVAYEKTPLDTP